VVRDRQERCHQRCVLSQPCARLTPRAIYCRGPCRPSLACAPPSARWTCPPMYDVRPCALRLGPCGEAFQHRAAAFLATCVVFRELCCCYSCQCHWCCVTVRLCTHKSWQLFTGEIPPEWLQFPRPPATMELLRVSSNQLTGTVRSMWSPVWSALWVITGRVTNI
jgi:hypothetical protein